MGREDGADAATAGPHGGDRPSHGPFGGAMRALPRRDQTEGTTRPVPLARAFSKRFCTSAQFTMFQIALT